MPYCAGGTGRCPSWSTPGGSPRCPIRRWQTRIRPRRNESAEIDDRNDGTAAGRALVDGSDGHEDRRVAGHRCGDAADRGLDGLVPMHVGVVQHDVAAATDLTARVCLALEEHVDQAALQVPRMHAVLRQVSQAGVADGLPDAFEVERVAHDVVPYAVTPADAAHVADQHDLRLVQLDAR